MREDTYHHLPLRLLAAPDASLSLSLPLSLSLLLSVPLSLSLCASLSLPMYPFRSHECGELNDSLKISATFLSVYLSLSPTLNSSFFSLLFSSTFTNIMCLHLEITPPNKKHHKKATKRITQWCKNKLG